MITIADHDVRRVLGAFRHRRGDQLHVAVRLATCPMDEVLHCIPDRGHLLDVGCGHGVLALLAALRSPDLRVTGYDIDRDKLRAAEWAAGSLGLAERVRFVASRPDRTDPLGLDWDPEQAPADAVACIDVLYLLDPGDVERAVHTLASVLGDGSSLVIKEMDAGTTWKHRLAQFQERLAVDVLHLTKGGPPRFADPSDLARAMTEAGCPPEIRPVHRGRPHPHLLLVGQLEHGGSDPRRVA